MAKRSKKPANTPLIAKRLRAFRDCTTAYQKYYENYGGVRAVVIGSGGKGASSFNHATIQDFACDYQRQLKRVCPTPALWSRFHLTYLNTFDSEIEQNKFAHLMFKGAETNMELGLGALFISEKLWPVWGRGGFLVSIRDHAPTATGTKLAPVSGVKLLSGAQISAKAKMLAEKYSAAMLKDMAEGEVEQPAEVEVEDSVIVQESNDYEDDALVQAEGDLEPIDADELLYQPESSTCHWDTIPNEDDPFARNEQELEYAAVAGE